MITEVVKYADNWQLYPHEVFNCLDRDTNELTYTTQLPSDEQYYLFHCGDYRDKYQRVVNLRYVDACITEKHDKLTEYGFRLIREIGDYKFWIR